MDTLLEKEFIVTNAESASTVGSGGLNVLSTPSMIAFMENVALTISEEKLIEGQTTVGIEINAHHLAATAIGKTVLVKAALKSHKKKILTYAIEVYEGNKLIGTAEHKRSIVDSQVFMDKLN